MYISTYVRVTGWRMALRACSREFREVFGNLGKFPGNLGKFSGI